MLYNQLLNMAMHTILLLLAILAARRPHKRVGFVDAHLSFYNIYRDSYLNAANTYSLIILTGVFLGILVSLFRHGARYWCLPSGVLYYRRLHSISSPDDGTFNFKGR